MQDLNILIVGAGIAGLTAAGLLKERGVKPKIIERDPEYAFNKTGYMLGLLPLGGRVMNELNLELPYNLNSIEMQQYEIHKENGDLNKAFSLDFINKEYGSYRGIERQKLIDILVDKIGLENIDFETTITKIKQLDNKVEVTLSDRTKEQFDLVIAADGMHSDVRKRLWDTDEFSYYDTKWGGWVAWMDTDTDSDSINTYKEYWGTASFMGFYPVKDKTGLFLGGPNSLTKELGQQKFIKKIQDDILPEYQSLHKALNILAANDHPYYWEFHDVKTNKWFKQNVVLLGDAACGFLPTAGVGASMAMDSASALIDELSRSDSEHLEYSLKLFETRQKKRVESAQTDSRTLAKIMFVKSKLVSSIRDYSIRFYTLKQLVKNISKTIEGKSIH